MKLSFRQFLPFSFILFITFLTRSSFGQSCTLNRPAKVSFSYVASCEVTIAWTSVKNAVSYTIQYKASSQSNWTVLSNVGKVTSYTIAGLNANTSYDFKVAGVCINGMTGDYTQHTQKTNSCSEPLNLAVSSIGASSVTVSWAPVCGGNNFKLSYKLHSSNTWTHINVTNTPYNLTGLNSLTTYDVRVSTICDGGAESINTPAITFSTISTAPHSAKNVLLLLVDDSRQDSYTPDGGPSFFKDTNITRIATEGVHFKYCFPAESQCAPSRSSLYTGLYPHRTAVYNNLQFPDTITATTLAEILHDNGYYCGMVGKYHLSSNPQPGYDYWMENHGTVYFNATWDVNGVKKTIKGHKTDVVTDSAIGFLKRVPPGKPFYLEVGFAAPHTPYVPRTVDDTLYSNNSMPLAPYPDFYSVNYPSFLYPCQEGPANETPAIRGYFRMLAGVDYSVGRILDQLSAEHILDSTLIIFTSDNGYLLGEHRLDAKRIVYEPSIHLPLYMRYPPLIQAGTEINNQMAMIFDLPPTILDYVGISNPVTMDGISLKKIITGSAQRTEFFCEFFAEECTPDIRMVRSLNYKYVEYGCDSTTDEFFDLTVDPYENTNQIYNSKYIYQISQFRNDLANFEATYNYNTPGTVLDCRLTTKSKSIVTSSDADAEEQSFLDVYPNPAVNEISYRFYSPEDATYNLKMINSTGQVIYSEEGTGSILSKQIDARRFANGYYLLILQHGDNLFKKQFVINR